MALRGITLATLAGLSSLSVACGSSSKTDSATAAATCNPNDPTIPCYVGKAEPCVNFHTSFPDGDDLCLKPPDNGYQLHVGPTDYTDPTEMTKWTLPPGGFPGQGPDINFCYYMKSPNPTDIFTAEYYSHMRPGSHHFIMFGLNGGDVADSTGPDSCADRDAEVAGGANFLAGATREVQDAAMFGDAPEDAGLGAPVPANEQLNMNLHFVNITNNPVLMELWVNMIEKPASEVTDIVKAVEWYGGLTMSIAPGVHTTLQSPTTGCTAPLENTRLLAVTAHMHASTIRVSMYNQPAGAASRSLVFDDFDWSEPTVWRFNSVLKNPLPDRATQTSGSPVDGIFMTNPGDQYSWECEVNNQSGVTLTFSDKAYTGEMCNIFGMYSSPVAKNPWQCFF